jgi:hypothetical protein
MILDHDGQFNIIEVTSGPHSDLGWFEAICILCGQGSGNNAEPYSEDWVEQHECPGSKAGGSSTEMDADYQPLFAERLIGRCTECGYWRGQHIGLSEDDSTMLCPSQTTFTRLTRNQDSPI